MSPVCAYSEGNEGVGLALGCARAYVCTSVKGTVQLRSPGRVRVGVRVCARAIGVLCVCECVFVREGSSVKVNGLISHGTTDMGPVCA
jgi:hypothetical protein